MEWTQLIENKKEKTNPQKYFSVSLTEGLTQNNDAITTPWLAKGKHNLSLGRTWEDSSAPEQQR